MKTVFISIVIICLLGWNSYSQGQSEFFVAGQGDSVSFKILWAPINWPSDLKGVNVKRKSGDGDWVLLNEKPITPSTNNVNDLSDATNDQASLDQLGQVYDSLILNKKIPILSEQEMSTRFLIDSDKSKFLRLFAFMDFNFPLVMGYAYWDFPQKSGSYTYGLFAVNKSGEEASTAMHILKWQYGYEAKIDVGAVVESKKIKRKTGVSTVWELSTGELEEKNIKGFDIYRLDSLGREKKMNDTPIRVNMLEDSTSLISMDEEVDNSKRWSYRAVPISIFDIAGSPIDVVFQGATYLDLSSLTLSLGEDRPEDKSVQLEWEVQAGNPSAISGFKIYRKEKLSDESYLVSALLSSGVRTFEDTTILQSGYYFYEVEIESMAGENHLSSPLMVYKQLVHRPGRPIGLRGSVVKNGGERFVYLAWQSPEDAEGYQLYIDGIMSSGLALDGSAGIIEETKYQFPIKAQYGKEYRFAVSAVNNNEVEGELSDTLTIFIPSEFLPQINIWPIAKEDSQVTLNWEYPDFIQDLEGFRLYQNGIMVADESTLGSDVRRWQSEELETGKYSYELEAVTRFDISSQKSKPRNFNIQEP